jgi:hypothetical protein
MESFSWGKRIEYVVEVLFSKAQPVGNAFPGVGDSGDFSKIGGFDFSE